MEIIQYFTHYTEKGNELLVEQYRENEESPIFWRVSFEGVIIANNTNRPTKRELDMYSKMVDEQTEHTKPNE